MSNELVVLAHLTADQESMTTESSVKRRRKNGIPKNISLKTKIHISKLEEEISELRLIRDHYLEQIKTHLTEGNVISRLYCKTLEGRTIIFEINLAKHTIFDLKMLISESEGIPISDMRLIFAGKQLEDQYFFLDYSIMKESTLHLVLRLRGD